MHLNLLLNATWGSFAALCGALSEWSTQHFHHQIFHLVLLGISLGVARLQFAYGGDLQATALTASVICGLLLRPKQHRHAAVGEVFAAAHAAAVCRSAVSSA
jgi:hypothetical protein